MLQKKDYSGKSFANPYKRFLVSSPAKRRFKKIGRRLLFLLPALAVLGAGYVVFFTDYFSITEVTLAGEYQTMHHDQLLEQGRRAAIGKSILWLSTKKIHNAILSDDILSVSVNKKFPRTISIIANERIQKFQIQRGSESFLADQEGFVMQEGLDHSLVLVELPTTTPEIIPRTQALTKEEFVFFNNLTKELKEENGLKVAKISKRVKDLLDFNVFSQKKWFLVVDSTKTVEAYVNGLKTFLSEKYSIENNLQYIDMRIPDTIFYK